MPDLSRASERGAEDLLVRLCRVVAGACVERAAATPHFAGIREAAPTNGNACRGCPAQPTRCFWLEPAARPSGGTLPVPRQRRGPSCGSASSSTFVNDCGASRPRGERIALYDCRAIPRAGRDAYFQSVRGAHDSLPSGVIAGGAAKSHLHRRKSVRRAWSQGPRDVATGGAATKAALRNKLHRAPSRAARTRCVDARRRAP